MEWTEAEGAMMDDERGRVSGWDDEHNESVAARDARLYRAAAPARERLTPLQLVVIVLLLLLGAWATIALLYGQESVSLTTPIAGPAALAVLRPAIIDLNNVTGTVVARLLVWNGAAYVQDGRAVECVYTPTTAPTGQSLLIALNKANLTVQSLERRIMQQVATACPPMFPAGLPGTISGAPQ